MRSVVVAMALLLSVIMVNAQTTVKEQVSGSQQVVTPVPDLVSRDDLKKATGEIRRAIAEAERKSSVQAARDREILKKKNEEILKRTNEVETKLRAEVSQAAARQDELTIKEQARTRKMIYGGITIISLVVAIVIVVFTLNKPETKIPVMTTNDVNLVVPKPTRQLLTDPDIPTLNEFARVNGDLKRVMFRLTLQDRDSSLDGRQFTCMAELREGLPPLVYFDGELNPVAWDKRRKKAAQIAVQGTSQAGAAS